MQNFSRYTKPLVLLVCFLLLFLLQSTDLLTIRPLYASAFLLFPFTVTFCMFCDEITAAVTGLLVGIFLDSLSTAAGGFHTLFFLLMGLAVSFILHFLFNNNLRSALLLSLSLGILYYLLRCILFDVSHGFFEDAAHYIFRSALPSLIYTNLFTIPFYYFHRALAKK